MSDIGGSSGGGEPIVVVAGAANAGISTVVQTLGFPAKTIGTAVVRH